jgi:Ser/Thr protein kinase RdoA (MazF antagonist)
VVDLVASLTARGVSGVTDMRDTGSETDRTVLVSAASGPVVLKLSDSAHMQAALLQAVAASDPAVPVPRVLPDGDGSAVSATDAGDLFVMTTVPGIPLEDVELWPALVDDLADVQAALVTALATVPAASAQVPGENDWSIEAVTRHEHLVDDVADERHRAAMHDTVAHYRDALANLSNVLVADGRVSGVIDFGDAVEAPRVLDVAVTACYLAIALGSFDHPFVERYTARMARTLALSPAEESVVLPLAACRLVQAVVLARDTARREPDRADYVLRYDRAAVALLDAPGVRPARPVHLTSEGA